MPLEELPKEQRTCKTCSSHTSTRMACPWCERSLAHPFRGKIADQWTESRASRLERAENRIAWLEDRVSTDNAVCICGCPASDHEQLGEDGEQCEHEDHVCQRVAPSVRDLFVEMRRERDEAQKRIAELEQAILAIDNATRTDGSPPSVGMPTSTLIQVRVLVERAEKAERERDNVVEMHKRILSWPPEDVGRAKTVLLQFAAQVARGGGDGKRIRDAVDALERNRAKCQDEADALEARCARIAEKIREGSA